jgi:hypothetical protein
MNLTYDSPMNLDRVAFFGRTLKEYTRFFDLNLNDLRGRSVLDCPGGASSFAAEAKRHNIHVTAVDPQYANSPTALYAKGCADLALVMDKVSRAQELFVWKYYPTVDALRTQRTVAWEGFCADFQARRSAGRYLGAALPHLPFADNSFDVALSGHFLFLYGNLFPYEFHVAALRELVRVSREEVRVYPLQGLDAAPYPDLDHLRIELAISGIRSAVRRVSFEFQRGSTQVLVLRKG